MTAIIIIVEFIWCCWSSWMSDDARIYTAPELYGLCVSRCPCTEHCFAFNRHILPSKYRWLRINFMNRETSVKIADEVAWDFSAFRVPTWHDARWHVISNVLYSEIKPKLYLYNFCINRNRCILFCVDFVVYVIFSYIYIYIKPCLLPSHAKPLNISFLSIKYVNWSDIL